MLVLLAFAAAAAAAAPAPRLYRSAADCEARLSVDALVSEFQTRGAFPAELAGVTDGVVQYSFRYYTCRAFSEGTGVCKRLEPYDGWTRPRPSLECVRYSRELVFVHSLMTGSVEAPRLCLESLRHPEDREFEPEQEEAACRVAVEMRGDPEAACGKLQGIFKKRRQLEKCKAWLGGIQGNAKGCAAVGENDVKERCLAYAAFKSARAQKEASPPCAQQPLCALFSGGGTASCAPYVERIKRAVCRLYASGKSGAPGPAAPAGW